jgi:hypothetical protein
MELKNSEFEVQLRIYSIETLAAANSQNQNRLIFGKLFFGFVG